MRATTKAERAARSTGRKYGVDIQRDHDPLCSVGDCSKPFYCKGLCTMHYLRMRKRGELSPESQIARGADSNLWRGDDIGYIGAHNRVRAAKGRVQDQTCEHCSEPAANWAYNHADPDQRFELQNGCMVPFSLDVDNYFPLCVRCHRAFDRAQS